MHCNLTERYLACGRPTRYFWGLERYKGSTYLFRPAHTIARHA